MFSISNRDGQHHASRACRPVLDGELAHRKVPHVPRVVRGPPTESAAAATRRSACVSARALCVLAAPLAGLPALTLTQRDNAQTASYTC